MSSCAFAAYSPAVVVISSAYTTLYLVFTTCGHVRNGSVPGWNRTTDFSMSRRYSPSKLQEHNSPGIPLTFRRSTPVGLYRLTLVERRGFEPLLLDFDELFSRLDLNQRPPPCEGGVLTRLNYRRIIASLPLKNHSQLYRSVVMKHTAADRGLFLCLAVFSFVSLDGIEPPTCTAPRPTALTN